MYHSAYILHYTMYPYIIMYSSVYIIHYIMYSSAYIIHYYNVSLGRHYTLYNVSLGLHYNNVSLGLHFTLYRYNVSLGIHYIMYHSVLLDIYSQSTPELFLPFYIHSSGIWTHPFDPGFHVLHGVIPSVKRCNTENCSLNCCTKK